MTRALTPPTANVLDRLRGRGPRPVPASRAGARRGGGFRARNGAGPGFVAAIVAGARKQRCWIICENARAQETVFNELLNWFPETAFFPEKEIALGENVLPDPEIAAERLALLQALSGGKVARRAFWS